MRCLVLWSKSKHMPSSWLAADDFLSLPALYCTQEGPFPTHGRDSCSPVALNYMIRLE
jgi:hypothetical protein